MLSSEVSAFFAHSANKSGRRHPLEDHLSSVSVLAAQFLDGLPGADAAGVAGVLHDLGKYADLFQARLRGEVEGLDHWSQGAWVALRQGAIRAALAVQGHHIGLQKADKDSLGATMDPSRLAKNHPLKLTLSDNNCEKLMDRFRADGLMLPQFQPESVAPCGTTAMLDVRMIFSALVDADFIDTEAHFNGEADRKAYRPAGPTLRPEEALQVLDRHLATKRTEAKCEPGIQGVRNRLWEAAGEAGRQEPGLWTLTAPTGSGKTLAMLRFALEHARAHGLRRVIVAIPYLSIIDQTAKEYREAFSKQFGDLFVLEHHSLAGLGKETDKGDAEAGQERMRRLLSENWDAPIVVTTNVQLLESLFSNRTSSCRKLHRLARSVILFDEAQALPLRLAVHTLAALSHLCAAYGSSVVFATATQPAFDHLDSLVQRESQAGWRPRPMIADEVGMFRALSRAQVYWPRSDEKISLSGLAEELAQLRQVLCILNLKRHAVKVIEALGGGGGDIFHLSTSMCPAHRRDVLDEVRLRLASGKPCKLISTQCVEAGVDLDFPVVYRAMGPLEAVAQAAGRCNRNGLLRDENGRPKLGEVRIVVPELDAEDEQGMYPSFDYWQAACVTQSLLAAKGSEGLGLNDPRTFRDYFQQLYGITKLGDKELSKMIEGGDFVSVAENYRLIPQDAIQVLVPYDREASRWKALRAELSDRGLRTSWVRQAQDLCVSIYRPRAGHAYWNMIVPAPLPGGGDSDNWYILAERIEKHYDPALGLKPPAGQDILSV